MLFCGIDLHSNNCFVVISDESDRAVYSKRHGNDLDEILSVLEPFRQEISGIVVESTYNWYWLVDGLQEAGYPLHLANTTAIKQYDGLKHRGDQSDAQHLAQLFRLGLLPEGHITPKAWRGVRNLARKRMQLVQQRSQHILAIETQMDQHKGCRLQANEIKKLSETDIDAMNLGTMEALAMKANLRVMQAVHAEIKEIEAQLKGFCSQVPQFSLLTSVCGIGDVLATVILLETGAIDRFAGAGNYASYCRCVGSCHVSNGKKKGEGNTKNGNRYLSWAFVEAAHYAIRYSTAANRFYQRKRTKRNGVVGIKAVAHKLARACYHMLKNGEPFSIERCFV